MQNVTIDLDNLMPESRTVTIGGKQYPCGVPTVLQTLKLEKLMVEIREMDNSKDIFDKIVAAIKPIFPAIDVVKKEINVKQLFFLLQFVQNAAIPPQVNSEVKVHTTDMTTEKKT